MSRDTASLELLYIYVYIYNTKDILSKVASSSVGLVFHFHK